MCEWTNPSFWLQPTPVNDLENSEAFSREWTQVNMGNVSTGALGDRPIKSQMSLR